MQLRAAGRADVSSLYCGSVGISSLGTAEAWPAEEAKPSAAPQPAPASPNRDSAPAPSPASTTDLKLGEVDGIHRMAATCNKGVGAWASRCLIRQSSAGISLPGFRPFVIWRSAAARAKKYGSTWSPTCGTRSLCRPIDATGASFHGGDQGRPGQFSANCSRN